MQVYQGRAVAEQNSTGLCRYTRGKEAAKQNSARLCRYTRGRAAAEQYKGNSKVLYL